jgi:hypothetical protein
MTLVAHHIHIHMTLVALTLVWLPKVLAVFPADTNVPDGIHIWIRSTINPVKLWTVLIIWGVHWFELPKERDTVVLPAAPVVWVVLSLYVNIKLVTHTPFWARIWRPVMYFDTLEVNADIFHVVPGAAPAVAKPLLFIVTETYFN